MSNPEIDPELKKCYGDIRSISRSIDDLVHDLTDAELVWKPHPGPWSIAQCLEHMAVTARADLPHLRRAIEEARSQRLFGHSPFRYGSLGWLLIKAMGASARFKFKAPRVYRPAEDSPPREVIREFFTRQQEILDCILEANGLHLARAKMSLPGHKHLRLSIGQEFRLLVVHEQRHVGQAKRMRNLLPTR